MKRYLLSLALLLSISYVSSAQVPADVRADPGYLDLGMIESWFNQEANIEVNVQGALLNLVTSASRHEDEELADMLGVLGITFILPQPVTGSLEADSELPPQMWAQVRDEVAALAARPGLRTAVAMDYGAPFAGPELPCETFAERRVYVDAHGRMATCCQLSDYGFNETEVVADLNVTPFAEAYELYLERLEDLRQASRPTGDDPLDPYPCMRCVKASGKLDWLQGYAGTGWGRLLAAAPRGRVLPVLR